VRFNARYGDTFTVPEPHIIRAVGKIQDLADPTAKMSKSAASHAGLINLLDEPRVNVKKIKSAVTDSDRTIAFDEAAKPGVSNLLTILAALTDDPVDALVTQFEGRGYGDLKGAVAEAVSDFATPFRERTLELLGDRAELETILADGAERARDVAAKTVADVYAKVGLLPAR
jgi:tryptophanyl-tRNA synthetase